jgi:hypothetical protein
MTNLTTDETTDEQAKAMLAGFIAARAKAGESRKAPRKARAKRLSALADGRSLRQSRDTQLSIRTYSSIREAVRKHTTTRGKALTIWVEEAIIARLKAEGYEIDA